jgi:hypothetical protein
MTKFKTDRRSGVERREFHYTICIPERRSGIDRRCGKNGKEIFWIKYADKTSKEKQHGKVEAN